MIGFVSNSRICLKSSEVDHQSLYRSRGNFSYCRRDSTNFPFFLSLLQFDDPLDYLIFHFNSI